MALKVWNFSKECLGVMQQYAMRVADTASGLLDTDLLSAKAGAELLNSSWDKIRHGHFFGVKTGPLKSRTDAERFGEHLMIFLQLFDRWMGVYKEEIWKRATEGQEPN